MPLQTTNGSSREAWVKAFLPAAFIMMVYLLFVTFGRSGDLKRFRERHADALKSAVTEDELVTLNIKQNELVREQDKLNDQIEATCNDLAKLVEPFRHSGKSHAIAEISRLCQQHSIGLLSQKPATDVKLSSLRDESIKTLRELVGNDAVTFSQMDLQASYADVTSFLHALPNELPGALPVGLELLPPSAVPQDEDQSSRSERVWRLIILL